MNIKTPRISEFHQFCREYKHVVNFATIFGQNETCVKVQEQHKLQTAAIFKKPKNAAVLFLFLSYFFLLLSYFYSSFLIFDVLVFSFFFT